MTASSSIRSTPVLLAAGSNIDACANLRKALDILEQHFSPLQVSRAYANAAVGFEGEDFVNLAVAFATGLPVAQVIEHLHEAEASCGRERNAPKWAPRAMDLDILLFGDTVCNAPGLTLPRPDLLRRPYMLGPAAEVVPDWIHPTAHRTLGDLWAELRQRDVHELRPIELAWMPAGRRGP